MERVVRFVSFVVRPTTKNTKVHKRRERAGSAGGFEFFLEFLLAEVPVLYVEAVARGDALLSVRLCDWSRHDHGIAGLPVCRGRYRIRVVRLERLEDTDDLGDAAAKR